MFAKKTKKLLCTVTLACFLGIPASYSINSFSTASAAGSQPKIEQRHDNVSPKNEQKNAVNTDKKDTKHDNNKADKNQKTTTIINDKNDKNPTQPNQKAVSQNSDKNKIDKDNDKNAKDIRDNKANDKDKNTPSKARDNTDNKKDDGISTSIVVGNVVGAIINKGI